MPRCHNCGSHVTVQFARVFGDNDDSVHNCIDCATNAELDQNPDAGQTVGVGPPRWQS
ncbi:MAG: hypothetical protein ABEJ90_00685 [Halobacterium sp.]